MGTVEVVLGRERLFLHLQESDGNRSQRRVLTTIKFGERLRIEIGLVEDALVPPQQGRGEPAPILRGHEGMALSVGIHDDVTQLIPAGDIGGEKTPTMVEFKECKVRR